MSRPWDQYEGSACKPAVAERAAVRAQMERELFREQREEIKNVAVSIPAVGSPGPCKCEMGGPVNVRQSIPGQMWVRCQACSRGTGNFGTVALAVAAWESRMGRELFQEQREEVSEAVAYVTPTPGAPGLCECGTMPMLYASRIHNWLTCPGCHAGTNAFNTAGEAVTDWESRMGR